MAQIGPPLLALFIGSLVASLELVTSSYPRTFSFLTRCWELWAYMLVYGLISFSVTFAFDFLVARSAVQIEGIGVSNPWLRAVAFGLSTKALLHIRLFSVGVGIRQTPIGTETVVQIFEPWLTERILLHEFNEIRRFLASWEQQIPNVPEARSIIMTNLPYTFGGDDRLVFEASIRSRKVTTIECMELYLRRFGRTTFERAFGGRNLRPTVSVPNARRP
jgi:hypothetical protein